ncbi:hypothetical protein [Mycobacterium simiae]|nr:hypothetical protein X011_05200 [Mycobacterium tuberculosis variant microti OV254]
MPTLQVSQQVVAGLLGVVVLGETLDTGRGGRSRWRWRRRWWW